MTDSRDSLGVPEVKAAVDRLGAAFETFKKTNDRAAIERSLRGQADVLVEEKLGRVNREIDRLQRQVTALGGDLGRPPIGGTAPVAEADEHKAAFFDRYVRRGLETGLDQFEHKALSGVTGQEGGYAVPEQLDQAIERRLRDISPVRAIANVVQIGSGDYKKLVTTAGAASGWVGETAARIETDAPTFGEIVPPLGELYANPAATQTMLDDAFFDIEMWLAEELADEFASSEADAFINGNGSAKPKGFLTQPTATTDDDVRPFGTLQYIPSGASGAFASSNPADVLFDLVYAVKAGYRTDAAFVMNAATLATVRKLKDSDGQYLWRPGLEAGQPGGLLGYPVVEAAHMPDIGANELAIAFGNFRRGYTITDRMGTRVLRDPYSNKPYVHFYTTKRVGGAVVNSDAIKLIKFATT